MRPSVNNMHTFTATENSCFFDICLPNYTMGTVNRKITYYKDLNAAECLSVPNGQTTSTAITQIEYDTTPPIMPVNFHVKDIAYRGIMD